jgi:flavin-dependent dehydrogenase
VARLLNDRAKEHPRVVCAQEVEFELDPAQRAACAVDSAVPEIYFCRDLAGYGWMFRKGDYLNVGLGREDPHGLSAHVADFREFVVSRGRLPADTPQRFRGHAYHLYPRGRRKLIDDGVLLVGDSAGLAYAESGEGIRPAVESALIAADVILANGGDYRKDRLSSYERRVVDRFGARPKPDAATVGLPAGLKRFLATRLLGMPWFVQHVVARRWFLRRHLPNLSASGGTTATARPV